MDTRPEDRGRTEEEQTNLEDKMVVIYTLTCKQDSSQNDKTELPRKTYLLMLDDAILLNMESIR